MDGSVDKFCTLLGVADHVHKLIIILMFSTGFFFHIVNLHSLVKKENKLIPAVTFYVIVIFISIKELLRVIYPRMYFSRAGELL